LFRYDKKGDSRGNLLEFIRIFVQIKDNVTQSIFASLRLIRESRNTNLIHNTNHEEILHASCASVTVGGGICTAIH
jgi:hypothetical protein